MADPGRVVEIRQGETWAFDVYVSKADDTPLDLTGATVTGAVRLRPGEPVAAVIDCVITDAAGGKIGCVVTDEKTELIAAASSYKSTKTYYFDVRVELSSGVAFYPDYGTLVVTGGVQIE